MSKPFEDLHIDLNSLQPHPEPHLLRKALLSGGQPERLGLANLWLSEGIPHAFMSSPAVYQQLRSELSRKLHIGVKDISVVGSSRMGYSLADYKFGKEFGKGSDLDLCVVNSLLFDSIKADTEKFIEDVKTSVTTASSLHTQKFWIDSCERLPDNIRKGFIDIKKIPAISGKYDCICSIKQNIYLVSLRLQSTKNIPDFKSISIRFYRDWQSMVDQVARSLYRLTKHLESQGEVTLVAQS
ncbi:hypothetical protein ACQKEN_01320 [Pseudomonas sp. NPDC078416]|uniref:hypothetical protein n=1 Tax=Pseudomonas sp. NPDC078416 TaxID=3390637 RepID=UPI003D03D811